MIYLVVVLILLIVLFSFLLAKSSGIKANLSGLALGIVLGLLIGGITLYKMAPDLMMKEDVSKYDFETTVKNFENEVKAAGWSIPTIHDMQATLNGFGHKVDEIKIFELCSSKYSAEILKLNDERVISPMMPCRVSIYTKSDGKTYIGRMNSGLLAKFFGGVVDEVMKLAADETEAILEKLIK